MRRRAVRSSGPVVLVAAAVTAIALLLGSSRPQPRAVALAAVSPAAGHRHGGNPRPAVTLAQLRNWGGLASAECGLGHGGRRSQTAPSAQLALSSAHGGGDRVRLYVVNGLVVVCSTSVDAADSLAPPQQQPPAASPNSISFGSVTGGDSHGQRATVEYGRAGAAVRDLRFVLASGASVAATVRHGWFLIWWPSASSPKLARLTTGSGVRTLTLGATAASPPLSCPRNEACFASSMQGQVVSSSASSSVTIHGHVGPSLSVAMEPAGAGLVKAG